MYGASKAAIESITMSLAKELGTAPLSPSLFEQVVSRPRNSLVVPGYEYEATVNAVNPGPVRTQM